MPKERNSRKSTGRRRKSNSTKGRACFNCHKEGHWASKCPSKIKSSTDISDDQSADDPQVIKSRRDLIPETKSTQTNIKMWNYTPKLAEFLGKKMASHAEAFKIVFDYVEEHHLLDPDPEDSEGLILPDKKMSKIFGYRNPNIGEDRQTIENIQMED